MGRGMIAMLGLLLCVTGCVRRAGRNADCRWPGESAGHSVDARHLSADAEFAEDLAIRYADTHHGLRTPHYVSGSAYATARDRCMGSLFAEVAKTHEVSSEAVSNSLGRNRGWIDLAMILPLVLLYGAVAAAVARVVWRRYPPREDGWIPGAVMILFLSLAVAAGSIMLGELWCWNVETLRVGNGHMSFRIQRLWWVRHQAGMFAGGVIAFWTVSVWSASPRSIRRTSTGSGSPWPGGSGRALRG